MYKISFILEKSCTFAACNFKHENMDIRAVIKKQGWTLERLAEEMYNSKTGVKGISQASVSQILNGNPTLDKLKEIASIIGVSLSELVGDGDRVTFHCPKCGEVIKIEVK